MRSRFALIATLVLGLLAVLSAPPHRSAATPDPGPTAVSATAEQKRAVWALAPAKPPSGAWALSEYAVAGTWALVGYYNRYAGITALLQRNSSGGWTIVRRGGGQLSALALQKLEPTMPSRTAQSLYNLAVRQDKP